MSGDCNFFREQIPRSMFGDLAAGEQRTLELHLADCPACSNERDLYSETFRRMKSLDDEPVPRHFFVYPRERSQNPWRLFRQMSLAWQGALSFALVAVAILTVAAAGRLQMRAEDGGWVIAFGKLPSAPAPAPALDTAALESRILQLVEEKNRKENLEWVRTLRSEIGRSQRGLTQRQQVVLETALAGLESRMSDRLQQTAGALRNQNDQSIANLYQAVSVQRDRDLAVIDGRFARLAVSNDIKDTQTNAILETLLQVAELRVK